MGYAIGELRIPLRAERHNSAGDKADDEAIESLKMEINALIDSTPEYGRVASLGCEGGV